MCCYHHLVGWPFWLVVGGGCHGLCDFCSFVFCVVHANMQAAFVVLCVGCVFVI